MSKRKRKPKSRRNKGAHRPEEKPPSAATAPSGPNVGGAEPTAHSRNASDPQDSAESGAPQGDSGRAGRKSRRKKRVLIVTPEITYLPEGMGNMANHLQAKAGGLADVSATLAAALYAMDADVHVALPHYRQMFSVNVGRFINEELRIYKSKMPEERIHLAEDRIFYYRSHVYDDYAATNMELALTFQREVINNIIPRVNPDLVHCNDWMTGLIPAVASRLGIKSLFTVHNIHSLETSLEHIERTGIDAREFWQHLYYKRLPKGFEESYPDNPVDFLTTGIFASDAINTVSPRFLDEIVAGQHSFVKDNVFQEIRNKVQKGAAEGVLNSPDPSYNPRTDTALERNFGPDDAAEAKRFNKTIFQEYLGLDVDPEAALFFWPSRLDPNQKGCQLLTEILHRIVVRYREQNLQVVLVANGPYQKHFNEIVERHELQRRVSVCAFDERISRMAYGSADYLFMPSFFEPCGLPQMIGPIYGTLPVARDTGGIHDTVDQLDADRSTGNGFLFESYDSQGLAWAVDCAMQFHAQPVEQRNREIRRIMEESLARFNHDVTAKRYIAIYRRLLGIEPDSA
ncbi:MAG: glycogen/starch synthase [Planctomycetota bacterium]